MEKISVHNFNAGPAVLPKAVLERAQVELLDYAGSGMSILEMSHRSPAFDAIMQKTEADLRSFWVCPLIIESYSSRAAQAYNLPWFP